MALTDDCDALRDDLATYSSELSELRALLARREEFAEESARQLAAVRLAYFNLSGCHGDLATALERTAREVGDATDQFSREATLERRRSQALRAELDRLQAAAPDPPPQPLPGTGLPPHSP